MTKKRTTMTVFLVYDENTHNDGYSMNHGIFATNKLAEEFIETGFTEYSNADEMRENAQIESFVVDGI